MVTAWLGNTPKIALKHYLMTTDADFQKAAQNPVHCGDDSVQKSGAAGQRAILENTRKKRRKPLIIKGLCYNLQEACQSLQESLAERTGFEPADQFPGHGFSKPALSTTQPPLQVLIA